MNNASHCQPGVGAEFDHVNNSDLALLYEAMGVKQENLENGSQIPAKSAEERLKGEPLYQALYVR